MKRTVILTALVATTVGSILMAQDAGESAGPFGPAPTEEHKWLTKFEGTWDLVSEASMGPDQPPVQSKGTLVTRMLGEYWIVAEMDAEFMGTKIGAFQTIGYDSEKKKFIGTWIDTTGSYMWQYEGSLDDGGNTLTLNAEGPNWMAGGDLTNFRDVYEFKSDDHYELRSSMQTPDGQWVEFMKGEARRKD